ncbi:hypothetical protein [Staphylococcus hyicus]|uniref:hypothetical protein n=1 Tax=Staphylococcus hyicus TaxID=1284 RepID=UPI000A94196B|nr:hypothetical protein [Staphylococcus hyicus]MDY3698800.1 hypothetical protein [Staphylococcus hyicus]SQE47306.1 Uncharacterised protein [Staphylococcus hyicus]
MWDWFINIGGVISSSMAIVYIILFIKYKFYDKNTTLKINVYSTLTDGYKHALKSSPEDVRKYFLKTFPIEVTSIVHNEFISEKRKNIIAELILSEPNNIAFVIGSDDHDIKISNIYSREGKVIKPLQIIERKDVPNKNPEEVRKGHLYLMKGDYVAILTQEFGYESSQKIELVVRGHKILYVLTPNLRIGVTNYINAKNTFISFIKTFSKF